MAAIGHNCQTDCSEYRYVAVFSYTETQSQIPQIWHDYMGEPEAAHCDRVTRRFGGISLVNILTTYFGFSLYIYHLILDIPPLLWVFP